MYDLAMDIGQSEIPSTVPVGQPLVVQSHQVQDCGMQVVHMDAVVHRRQAKLVGCPVGESWLDAPPRPSRP